MSIMIGIGISPSLNTGGRYQPPFDQLPPTYAAFSLAKLYSSYNGPIVRLRRSSDNAELDFYSSADGWPDKAAIDPWRDVGDAFIVTFYDPSGQGRHMTAAVAANQTKLSANCRTFNFDGINDTYAMANSTAYSRNQAGLTMAAVVRVDDVSANRIIMQTHNNGGVGRMRLLRLITAGNAGMQTKRLDADTTVNRFSASDIGSTWHRIIGRRDYANALDALLTDGIEAAGAQGTPGNTSDTASSVAVHLGSNGTGGDFLKGDASVFVFFQSAISDAHRLALDAALVSIMEQSFNGAAFALWGDSLSFGDKASTAANRWGNLLANSYTPRVEVYNGGVGGQTSQQILARVLASTQYRSRINTFWFGRNNFEAASTQGQIDQAVIDIQADLASATRTASKFIVISVLPYADGHPGDSAAKRTAIAATNAALAATYGDRFLDVTALLADSSTRDADGVHLNDAGNIIVNDAEVGKVAALGWM